MMKHALYSAVLIGSLAALAGCASTSKSSIENPRAVTVVEVIPESDWQHSIGFVSRGRAAVGAAIFNNSRDGGNEYTLPGKIPEIIEETKAAVRDDCTVRLIVEFEDTKKRLSVTTRCVPEYAVGMHLTIQRRDMTNARSFDPRDVVIVTKRELSATAPSTTGRSSN